VSASRAASGELNGAVGVDYQHALLLELDARLHERPRDLGVTAHGCCMVEWLHGLKTARAAVATPATFTVNRPAGTLFVEFVHHHADGILTIHERAAGEPRETLTPREREVVALVGDGMRNSEIAETLWVSPGTVRKHLENIYNKLGVHTRTAAVAQVRRSD
jgi:DNA-binding CsgD family transcriptional regulator